MASLLMQGGEQESEGQPLQPSVRKEMRWLNINTEQNKATSLHTLPWLARSSR